MIRAIIFDADNTLYSVESDEAYKTKFAYLAETLERPAAEIQSVWEDEVDDVITSSDPEQRHRATVLDRTLDTLGVADEEQDTVREEALEAFWETVVDHLDTDPALPQLFDQLKAAGVEQFFVASDEFRKPLEQKLAKAVPNWQEVFTDLITPEKTQSMKPADSFYTEILATYSIDPEDAMMVGDSWRRDLAKAKEQGMVTVLKAEQREGEPDHTIRTLEELPEIIREYNNTQ